MDGTYRIGTDHIRSLAIQCHALDLQFDRLFNGATICGYSDRIYQTYNRLFSTALLNLAISIRVSLNRDPEYTATSGGILACGLFDDAGPHDDGRFSIKDVCDKLIHAEQITKPIEPGASGVGCELVGRHHKRQWRFGLGVQILTEWVLAWLDRIDNRSAGGAASRA
ncbi:MAG: hypothetical protein IPK26_30390 [Planctomycetes bacterium]|nr:hypothetical protein [Planctomycetota bacterium]